MRVERALFIVNAASGTGLGATRPADLASVLERDAGVSVDLVAVTTHDAAREAVQRWLDATPGAVALVVGGGGGTLRAAVEGACAASGEGPLPDADRVRFAPLRMGSGNLVAKRLGYAKDPALAMTAIARSLREDRTRPGAILRAELGRRGAPPRLAFATSLIGLGLLGRTARDMARGPRRFKRLRRALSRVIGLERLNHAEALACVAARAVQGAAWSPVCERVRVSHPALSGEMRLLTGIVLAFPVPLVPLHPCASWGEAALSAHLVPYPTGLDRARILLHPASLARDAEALRLEPGADLTMELIDREEAECFLDEDPETFVRTLTLACAGTLAFVPPPPSPSEEPS